MKLLLVAILMGWAGLAAAQEKPLTYSRDTVVIMAEREGVVAEEAETKDDEKKGTEDTAKEDAKDEEAEVKKEEKKDATGTVKTQTFEYPFNTEIRPWDSSDSEGFVQYGKLPRDKAIMQVLEEPDVVEITPVRVYQLLDALLVAEDGRIEAIIPNLRLGDLNKPIITSGMMKAVMYISGGLTEELGILPGDTVRHSHFTESPKILQ